MSKPTDVYVLDTSAWLTLIEDEAGADLVQAILEKARAGKECSERRIVIHHEDASPWVLQLWSSVHRPSDFSINGVDDFLSVGQFPGLTSRSPMPRFPHSTACR